MTTPSPFFSTNTNQCASRRRAVSPVIATTIILAITIVLGLSLWSFANAGVSTATQTYSDSITEYGKFTADRFVIASVAFNHPSTDHVSLWIYNSGKVNTVIDTVLLTCKDCVGPFTPIPLTSVCLESGSMTVTPKTLQLMDLNPEKATCVDPLTGNPFPSVTLSPGTTYQVQAVSETGAHQTIYQKDE
jgi:flagellin-like protein